MDPNLLGRRIVSSIAIASIALSPAYGQDSTDSSDEETVFELSPFLVDASQDSGYTATNTMAGSRLNASLLTTAAPVSVMTRDFLDDINATDVMQALDWAVNTQPLLQESESINFEANVSSDNGVMIRGLLGSQARNYFRWSVASDGYNIERLDLARGPNNILFGTGGVGGMLNVSTKRARIGSDRLSTSFMIGSFDAYRATVDVSKTLNEKAAVRLNGVWDDRGDWINNASQKRTGAHLASTIRLTDTTTLILDAEKLSSDRVVGRTFPQLDRYGNWNGVTVPVYGELPPEGAEGISRSSTTANSFVFDAGNGTFMNWMGSVNSSGTGGSTPEDIRPRTLNMFGPDDFNNVDAENYSLFIEQKVGDSVFLELAFNQQKEDRFYRRSRAENLYVDANAQLPDGSPNPNVGDYYVEGALSQFSSEREVTDMRFTASYSLDTDGWLGSHQFAAVVSQRDSEYESLSESERDLVLNAEIRRRKYLGLGDGPENTGIPPIPTNNDLGILPGFFDTALNGDATDQKFWQFSSVSKFWDDRVTFTVGLRNDTLDQIILQSDSFGTYGETRQATGRTDEERLADQDTASYGVVFGVTDDLYLFFNQSENFNPQGGRDVFYNPLGPRAGESWDTGVKFRLFENRLNGSVAYYETADAGGLHYMHGYFVGSIRGIWDRLEPGRNQGGFQDRQDSAGHGWELDLTANPTENLRLSFNASRGTVSISNHGKFFRNWMDENLPIYEQIYSSGINFEGIELGDDDLNFIRTRLDRMYEADTFWWNDGISPLRQREHRANLFADYSFRDGTLEGFSVGLGLQYRDAPIIDYEAGVNPGDPSIRIFGNDLISGSLKLGYKRDGFMGNENIGYKVQLNVKNLFQNDMVEMVGAIGDQEGGTVNYRRPREFFLTNSFTF